MEKYCKSCGRVFKDSDFKICPYCGNQLSTRTGRQPIPRKLRHQVFQRDCYRCRECGATNKQTRLHVDHIKPVAKGGTNDLSNLQTLCEACNRAKYTDEWIGGSYDGSHSNFKQKNRITDSKLYESNAGQRAININKQSEKKYPKKNSKGETTQKKINRWKRAGWGATQEEMERWEKARKDNKYVRGTVQKSSKWQKSRTTQNDGSRWREDRLEVTQFEVDRWERAKKEKDKREKARREKFRKEKARKEEARIKSESTVVTGEVKCLREGTYIYTYKTSDGKKGSIYGSSIEDLKIKSRQYKIQWNP